MTLGRCRCGVSAAGSWRGIVTVGSAGTAGWAATRVASFASSVGIAPVSPPTGRRTAVGGGGDSDADVGDPTGRRKALGGRTASSTGAGVATGVAGRGRMPSPDSSVRAPIRRAKTEWTGPRQLGSRNELVWPSWVTSKRVPEPVSMVHSGRHTTCVVPSSGAHHVCVGPSLPTRHTRPMRLSWITRAPTDGTRSGTRTGAT